MKTVRLTSASGWIEKKVESAMFHLDYLSCFLTVLATILLTRKSWTGLLIAIVNSLIICAIALRTSQLGFIQQTCFASAYTGLACGRGSRKQTHTNRDQAQRQDSDSVANGPRMSAAMQHRTAAGIATEGAQVSKRNAVNHYPISPDLPSGVLILTKTPFAGCLHHR